MPLFLSNLKDLHNQNDKFNIDICFPVMCIPKIKVKKKDLYPTWFPFLHLTYGIGLPTATHVKLMLAPEVTS